MTKHAKHGMLDAESFVLSAVMTFIGPYHFLPVAAVCSAFHKVYRGMHGSETGTSIALSSKAMAQFTAISPTAVLMEKAAGYGKVEVMQWFLQQRCPWDSTTCASAANGGHLACLQWARTNGCPWDSTTCSGAAGSGHLHCLQWARTNGCPWDENTCRYAALNGHLDCLQWAHNNGCPWDRDTCTNAASNGHLACLQWARDNGCPED